MVIGLPLPSTFNVVASCCSLGTSPMIRSYDMGYISTRMMECEDAFSDMGSLKQNLELPPEYAYDDGKNCAKNDQ